LNTRSLLERHAAEGCLLADVGVCCVAWGAHVIDSLPLSKHGVVDSLQKLDEGRMRYRGVRHADGVE